MNLDKIQTGDVAHCRGRSFLAKSILFMTRGEFSHSAIFYKKADGKLFVIDAQKDGFQMRSYENWVKDYGYTFKVTRSHRDRHKIEERIEDLLGTTPYDFESLILRQPVKIIREHLNKIRKNDKEPWKNRGEREHERMYCSEAVAYCLNIPTSYQLSPQELWEYCSKNHLIIEG